MRKAKSNPFIIRYSIFDIRYSSFHFTFIALIFITSFFFPRTAPASLPDPARPLETASQEKGDSNLQKLLGHLTVLEEPVSREGAGLLIVQAPGERYRLQFRLIARGPEAFRLEIFDPFGRPMIYMVSYLGETHIFSLAEKREIPITQPLSGPLAAFATMPITEISKIFWGYSESTFSERIFNK